MIPKRLKILNWIRSNMSGSSNSPRISVILNCYNSEMFLADAIESVLRQTFEDFELIFWDNQSTDSSASIVKSYTDPRIKYFYANEFNTLGVARNLAIANAKGEWLAFIDSDDLWDKYKLEESIRELKLDPKKDEVSLIYTRSRAIDSEGNTIGHYTKFDSGHINEKLLSEGNFIVQSSIMVRSDIFKKVGGINTRLSYCPDYDMLLKISREGMAIGVNKELTSYRVHSGSITSTKDYAYNSEIIEYVSNYVKENPQRLLVLLLVKKILVYRSTTLLIKMVLNLDFNRVFEVVRNTWIHLLFFPFVMHEVLIKRFFGRVGN